MVSDWKTINASLFEALEVERVAMFFALSMIVLVAASAIWLTDGFGAWDGPRPVVKPLSATVFSPGAAPDNPQKAELAIDGNPETSWPTVTYSDPVPFPNFIEGEGLLLRLSEPTALSASCTSSSVESSSFST